MLLKIYLNVTTITTAVPSFDLAESQNQVLAGQDSTAFSVTYHLSQEDADANTNALAIPYFNTNTTEQIFVRIENNANTSSEF